MALNRLAAAFYHIVSIHDVAGIDVTLLERMNSPRLVETSELDNSKFEEQCYDRRGEVEYETSFFSDVEIGNSVMTNPSHI